MPQNSVRLSEFSPPKQYSGNSIPPVPNIVEDAKIALKNRDMLGFLGKNDKITKIISETLKFFA